MCIYIYLSDSSISNHSILLLQRSSQEYKDAVDLWELFCSLKEQIKTDGDLDSYRNRGRPVSITSLGDFHAQIIKFVVKLILS